MEIKDNRLYRLNGPIEFNDSMEAKFWEANWQFLSHVTVQVLERGVKVPGRDDMAACHVKVISRDPGIPDIYDVLVLPESWLVPGRGVVLDAEGEWMAYRHPTKRTLIVGPNK